MFRTLRLADLEKKKLFLLLVCFLLHLTFLKVQLCSFNLVQVKDGIVMVQ